MPAIRKIRIVNFRFNDGAKLIPDEIFCTENAEGKPIDTLLNLDNGGGKSVIVQLLLQPVCPKAKVQNRNICDYFQKGTDHAFVLIEWALDGSSNSLLTGIALAASATADDENESKTVRYYTFIHDYARNGDKLDLLNLPLTERTGSHIRPMSYDDLRKYLQNRKVEYYNSDSLHRYRKRLEEYGILYTEWENIIVRINTVEGGITKFFEEYRTADSLLDKFIIPGVMPNDTASAEALEEMFVNYANSYAGQEENLRLQSQIKSFTEKLQGILPLINNMWNAEDARIQAIRLLADHLFTLDHSIRLDSDRQAQLEKTIADLNTKMDHIKAEQASEAFYLAKESFDKACQQLEEGKLKKEEAETRCNKCSHKVSVLNAAKEYAEIIEYQNDKKALTAQIRELEQGTQDSRILSLKSSLSFMTPGMKQLAESNLNHENDFKKEQSDMLRDTQENISLLTKQHTEENNRLQQAKGSSNNLLKQIKEGLSALDLQITVMLDGEFSKDDIENTRIDYDKQIKLANDEIDNYKNEAERLEQEIEDQDTQRDELLQSQANCRICLKQKEALLEQYIEDYNKVLPILKHLSIPVSQLFTNEPLSSLDQILSKLKEEHKHTERSAELLTEQVKCIEAGQLHLSKTATNYLQESGISYQTGEQYLNYQSAKIRKDILTNNPLVAYAVIVDSKKEQIKLLSQTADSWLSSVVPVYTRSDLADIADGKWNEHNHFLSSFDKEYFNDASAYKEIIQKKLNDVKAEIEQLLQRISEWETERKILSQFAYSYDTEEQLQGQIDSCQAELRSIEDNLSALNKRRAEIKQRTDELSKLIDAEKDFLRSTENNKKVFEHICVVISQHEELNIQIADTESLCRQLYCQIDSERKEESNLSNLIKECDSRILKLREDIAGYQVLLDELEYAPVAEVLEEDYYAILTEYRLYKNNYSADHNKLQKQLSKIEDSIRRKTKDIERFNIEPAEYESVAYSDDAYHSADEQYIQAHNEYKMLSEQYSKAVECHAKAESSLEQAKTKLSELHTELLSRSEVGSDFERRIRECESALNDSKKDIKECVEDLNELIAERKYAAKYAERFATETKEYTPKISENRQDTNILRNEIENCIELLKQSENKTKKYHRCELEPFRNVHTLFAGTLEGIISVIDNHSITGDKYFTLYERTEGDIKRYQDRIAQLDVLLKDVEDSRKQLVTNCLQRVGRLYENLTILSKKSTVQIGSIKKHMIRIDLPDIDPMSEQPAERISQYITEQVKIHLSEQEASLKSHHEHLKIRRLLNCYIDKEIIPISVFKIDKNIQNSRYRSWQDALKSNSESEYQTV